jgi:hypothetical protein
MTVGTMPEDHIGPSVSAADVRAALSQLHPEYLQVVTEMYFRLRTVEQTSEVLGIPAATVISRSYYGLCQLKDTISLTGIDVGTPQHPTPLSDRGGPRRTRKPADGRRRITRGKAVMVATLPTTPGEWHEYLTAYSAAYLDRATENDLRKLDEQRIAARWLGYEPASEQMLAETEERLGDRLPPSLRGFLLTSDGWGRVDDWVDRLRPCREIEWFIETLDGAAYYEGFRSGTAAATPHGRALIRLMRHALAVGDGEDMWLLDTTRASANGEYDGYLLALKYGEFSDPYPSFSALFAAGAQNILQRLAKDP